MPTANQPTTCNLCGVEVGTPDELEAHISEVHEPKDDELRWWHWVLATPMLLWAARGYLVGLFIVVAIALGLLGVFDKEKTHDSKSCPGYHFVRNLKAKGQISTFSAVKPEDGWKCEYSLDNEDAEVRFKQANGEVQMEVAGRSTPAYSAADREARAEGFQTE